MKKRLMLLSVLLIIALAAMGCDGKDTAENVLAKAQENSQKVKSVTAKGTMNMKMTSQGQTVDMNYDMDMAAFSDPYKAKVDMTIDLGELGKQNSSVYLIPQDDKFYTYTQLDGAWYKQGMDKEVYEQSINGYNSTAYMDALVECKDSLTISEVDEDGKKCYKLEGTITGDAMKKMIEATNLKEQLSTTGADMSVYDNLGDLKIVAFVEKDNYQFYKLSIDMKEMMEKAMESVAKSFDSQQEVKIDGCTMDMEYTGYDNAEDFELPAEAKDAQELQLKQ